MGAWIALVPFAPMPPDPHPSDPRLLVLHALRLKGIADAATVAGAAGLPEDEAAAQLEKLAGEGLAAERTGALAGWSLTPAGRAEHLRELRAEVDTTGARATVTGAYERFRALNAGVLDACSRWQVRSIGGQLVRNDHRDPAYDARVVADLARLGERAAPLCDDLAGALARYRGYGPQLREAVTRVEAGEGDWFAKPLVPSFHTVWFELHEDLLTTLGLERSDERDEAAS
jgi:hypothetical protein